MGRGRGTGIAGAAGQRRALFAVLGGHCLLLAFTWPVRGSFPFNRNRPSLHKMGIPAASSICRGQVTHGHPAVAPWDMPTSPLTLRSHKIAEGWERSKPELHRAALVGILRWH